MGRLTERAAGEGGKGRTGVVGKESVRVCGVGCLLEERQEGKAGGSEH